MGRPTDEDMREGLEAIQQDMADHQRRVGKEVTASANQQLAAREFEKVEKVMGGMPEPSIFQPEAPTEDTFESRQINGRDALVVKGPDEAKFRIASPYEAFFQSHALARIELLLTKHEPAPGGGPSWYARVLDVQADRALASSVRTWASKPDILEAQKKKFRSMGAVDRAQMSRVLEMSGESDFTKGHLLKQAKRLENQYLDKLLILLDDSSKVFGDWTKTPKA